MPDETRPDPDALLASIQRDETRGKRGALKIFLGMAPGVGKTYAMLEAAQRVRRAGKDVVVGYLETHGRKETDALAQGLPVIPRKAVEHRGVRLSELDLDALLQRRPRLAIVDELAHTNVPGARHPKRHQDVQELLEAGIDVYSTLNVQHVASRAEVVREITGATIQETVPDNVLDRAEIELVDLPPPELLQRMAEGKVYIPERAKEALLNFFRESNLAALRETALRLAAEHVGQDVREYMQELRIAGPWKTGHRLLVAVGPSPLSEPLVRWTRRIAGSLHCSWVAVHVGSSHPLDADGQARLSRNMDLARELGAEVIATTDEDLVRGLLRIAREHNVTQIVVGKPGEGRFLSRLRRERMLRRLVRESGNVDVHVVRAEKTGPAPRPPVLRHLLSSPWQQYLAAALAVLGVAAVNLGVQKLAGPRVPGMVFLLAVVLLALFVGRGPVLLAGVLSALTWNYFFLSPRFTFDIASVEDAVLFGLYFVVAIVLGQLVGRIRAQELAERQREQRATALYQLTGELAQAASRDEIVWRLLGEIDRVFSAQAAVFLEESDRLSAHPDSTWMPSDKERSVAEWALRHRKAAGRFTDNLPASEALHLPLFTDRAALGALSVRLAGQAVSLQQRELLEAFARQAALVLDRQRLVGAAERARLMAESERLGRTLLNSVSHELRTPVAAITSALHSLREGNAPAPALLEEMETSAERLNRVVGNLLDAARLESGQLRPRMDWCDLADLVRTTLRSLGKSLTGREMSVELPPGPLLVQCDFVLLQEALANLLFNAAVHTPPVSPIQVAVRAGETQVELAVADRGPGLSPESIPRLFDKFYRPPGAPPGGVGLGLSIVKGFVEAQGGSVSAENRPGGGASFTIRLPRGQPPLPPREP